MAARQPFCEKKSEVARNAIESDFRSSKITKGSHFVKKLRSGEKSDQKLFSVIQNGRWQPFCEKKLRIDLKCGEKRSKVIFSHAKVIFSHAKWPPAAIL